MGNICCSKSDETAFQQITTHKDQQQPFFMRQKTANKVKRHVEEVGLVKDQIDCQKKGMKIKLDDFDSGKHTTFTRTSMNSASSSKQKKISAILVGAASAGKTSLIQNYLHNAQCPQDIRRSGLDKHVCTKTFGKNNVKLNIVDGTDEASLVEDRQKIYKSIDVFFICVSQSDRQSWNEVGKWKQEINEKCPNAPIFLVLTKDD